MYFQKKGEFWEELKFSADTNACNMTSNAIRGIRRKKSSLCEVKVAVIGAPGVGKSGKSFILLPKIIPLSKSNSL